MKRIIVTGPTASGKGGLAFEVARRLGGEIISLDSMKVYRGMDVGTAKASPERRAAVPYHLLDIVDVEEDFSVGRYLPLALAAVRDLESRGKRVIFQGGTALYLWALCEGLFEGPEADLDVRETILAEIEEHGLAEMHRRLCEIDPESGSRIHPNDQRRVVRALEVARSTGRAISECWKGTELRLEPGTFALFAIRHERADLYRRIERRVLEMVENGLFDEARRLGRSGRALSRTAAKCIGYREILDGDAAGESAAAIVERIQRNTRRFAKQQLTWFRRFDIIWLDPGPPATVAAALEAALGALEALEGKYDRPPRPT